MTDSDELLAFEMSPLSHAVGTICRKSSIGGILAWAEYGTNSRHRELIRHCIRVHSGPLNEQMWRAKEIESAKVIDTIDELGRLSRLQLLWRYPTVLIYLLHATMLGRARIISTATVTGTNSTVATMKARSHMTVRHCGGRASNALGWSGIETAVFLRRRSLG